MAQMMPNIFFIVNSFLGFSPGKTRSFLLYSIVVYSGIKDIPSRGAFLGKIIGARDFEDKASIPKVKDCRPCQKRLDNERVRLKRRGWI
jgi:hypothetical protein